MRGGKEALGACLPPLPGLSLPDEKALSYPVSGPLSLYFQPFRFGFSDHLLIALWDLSLTGCVPSLACSSLVNQMDVDKKGGPFPLARFFSEDYRALFSNPLHDAAFILQQPNQSLRNSENPLKESKQFLFRSTHRARRSVPLRRDPTADSARRHRIVGLVLFEVDT